MLKGNFLSYIRETVTITRPMPSSYVRGVTAPLSNAPSFSIRMHEDVTQTIDEAAALLKMDRSQFIRWCSKQVALDILRQKQEYDNLKET